MGYCNICARIEKGFKISYLEEFNYNAVLIQIWQVWWQVYWFYFEGYYMITFMISGYCLWLLKLLKSLRTTYLCSNVNYILLVSNNSYFCYRLFWTQAGTVTVNDFHQVLQDVTNFPLRPFVLPFLKANIPLLSREITALAAITNQTPIQYLRTHQHLLIESSRPSSNTTSAPGKAFITSHRKTNAYII